MIREIPYNSIHKSSTGWAYFIAISIIILYVLQIILLYFLDTKSYIIYNAYIIAGTSSPSDFIAYSSWAATTIYGVIVIVTNLYILSYEKKIRKCNDFYNWVGFITWIRFFEIFFCNIPAITTFLIATGINQLQTIFAILGQFEFIAYLCLYYQVISPEAKAWKTSVAAHFCALWVFFNCLMSIPYLTPLNVLSVIFTLFVSLSGIWLGPNRYMCQFYGKHRYFHTMFYSDLFAAIVRTIMYLLLFILSPPDQ